MEWMWNDGRQAGGDDVFNRREKEVNVHDLFRSHETAGGRGELMTQN